MRINDVMIGALWGVRTCYPLFALFAAYLGAPLNAGAALVGAIFAWSIEP